MTNETSSETSRKAFSFIEAEHEVLNFWKDKAIFKKSLQQSSDKPEYVFYDGPPFATGLPHHGHLVASTIKDIIPRYHTMLGNYVERRFGWDCHGLPIEHEIDKALGMSAKEAVDTLGIAHYNNECRSIVQRYTEEWEKTISRLGRWVDFENDYRTMEPWFMESVWWVFKQLWDKGLVYKGEKVVAYSTALETVLSNFEASSNYKDVQDPAVTVLFKLKDEDAYVAAWTTTPWTLPSNLALCVGPDIDYIKVYDEASDRHIWCAQARQQFLFKDKDVDIVATAKGHELQGKTYHPLFSYFSSEVERGAFQILSDNYVSTESGTGVVHMAPAFGEDDQRVCKEHGVTAFVCPLDGRGRFTEEVTDFAGQYIKDADKNIMKHLKGEGLLFKQETLMHSYPHCPRSDTPIIYRSVPSWYIQVTAIKDNLVENNRQINWIPEHIQEGRMGKWLENAIDWAVSRNRYWGTPLPIWINNKTGNMVCIGSIEELKALTGVEVDDLHRDFVDELTFSKDGEEGVYQRIPEVFDCWFESGSMPYAQVHYPFKDKERFESCFPAAFIAEGVDQTRGWFYTLQVLSECLFGKPAFKNVIVNGIVNAQDGKKMSKRLKNYTAPDILMEQYGADALRLYLINSGLVKAEEQRFTDAGVQEMVRQVLLPWYNGFKFFTTYADIDGWQVDGQNSNILSAKKNILDQWIVSKLETLKQRVNEEMQAYRLYNVVPPLFDFLEQLTNWYIRLNRARFWQTEMNDDKQDAYATLYYCLDTFSCLMAPFAPFLSEHVFQGLKKFCSHTDIPESVHLCDYPEADIEKSKPSLEASVERFQNLVSMGRQKRNDLKIKLKTPLSRGKILHKDPQVLEDVKQLSGYIAAELNIKQIEFSTHEEDYISVYAKANFQKLGRRLGKRMKHYAALIQNMDDAQLSEFQEHEQITLDDEVFNKDDIMLFREAKEGVNAVSNRFISMEFDPTLTEELIAEGAVREVINRIQNQRKSQGLEVTDRISLCVEADDTLLNWIKSHEDYLMGETLTEVIRYADATDGEVHDTEHGKVTIVISKQ